MDFLGMGSWEVILILVIALLVLGPQRLQSVARGLGRGARELRKLGSEVSQALTEEETSSKGSQPSKSLTSELNQSLQELKKFGSEVSQALTEGETPPKGPETKDER